MVLLLGAGFYLIKLMYSPVAFTLGDELQHWRTTDDILQSGRIFTPNAILPVSPFFPGLEILTVALAKLVGLDIFTSGVVVVGVARITGVLALFLFYEQVSKSARLAGIAALFYISNPHFAFFDAQFAYESLALPLAMYSLFLMSSQNHFRNLDAIALNLIVLLGVVAVVTTHHVTSYMLNVFLVLWLFMLFYTKSPVSIRLRVLHLTLFSAVATLTWLATIAILVIGYLSPWVLNTIREVLELVAGESGPREFFTSASGQPVPLWMRAAAFTSVLLILLGLPLGLWEIWKRHRTNALVMTLAVVALGFPALHALRLTPFGLGLATRGMPFVFFGVSFVVGAGALRFLLTGRSLFGYSVFVSATVVIFVGTMASILAAWHLPGSFLPGVYTRSVDTRGTTAAVWARDVLGTNQRFASNNVHQWLLGSYGAQRVVTHNADRVWTDHIFRKEDFQAADKRFLRESGIEYILQDRRPWLRTWSDEEVNRATDARDKELSRVYDSGDILIYGTGEHYEEP